VQEGSVLENIFDPMFELRADFDAVDKVIINGKFDNITAVDSLCLGNTNAYKYKLTTREGNFSGKIQGRITINNFDEAVFIDSFSLELEGIENEDEDEKLYLGYLYLGEKTVLPRFAIEPNTGLALTSEASRSFGGQVFGMKRTALESFGVNFPRLTLEERGIIKEYVKAVQTVQPHIIDPYHEAREEFPPLYVILNKGDFSFQKRNEDGFYFSGSLSWQEAN
jgi:hypothetical protein